MEKTYQKLAHKIKYNKLKLTSKFVNKKEILKR